VAVHNPSVSIPNYEGHAKCLRICQSVLGDLSFFKGSDLSSFHRTQIGYVLSDRKMMNSVHQYALPRGDMIDFY
jgi:hypothetical protein